MLFFILINYNTNSWNFVVFNQINEILFASDDRILMRSETIPNEQNLTSHMKVEKILVG